MPGEAIVYHVSTLKPKTKGDGPIGTLEARGEIYNYLTHDSEVVEKEYWHHFADMPLPKSFQLFDYVYASRGITSERKIPLTKAFAGQSSKFLLNIREDGASKVTYDFVEADGEFQLSSAFAGGTSMGWDYKGGAELQADGKYKPLRCGAKCREGIYYGFGTYKLLVFYTSENVQDDRHYYIPCLGKIECNTSGSATKLADVVFFNATREELIRDWLLFFHRNPINKQPGIADNLNGEEVIKEFSEGGTVVKIKCTTDKGKLFYEADCKALEVTCP